MPIPAVPWRELKAPAPPAGQFAECVDRPSSSSISLPSLGRVDVADEGVESHAPDERSQAALRVRLGRWAHGEYLARQGHRVLRGCAVVRDGKAVVLYGGARAGATVLGLMLRQRGWRIAADGNVIVTPDGLVLSGNGEATVDGPFAREFLHDLPRDAIDSGRDRVRVLGNPLSEDASVVVYGLLLVTQMKLKFRLELGGCGSPETERIGTAAFPRGDRLGAMPERERFRLVRQQTLSPRSKDHGIAALATQVADLLDGLA